ncbi:MAG: DNA topoisomerase IV subunit A [Candidatus Aenigmarchaeota archaeon]|nr:DNA topoisomerase IV subunit A [Candidatus Aenigmarchaeota archaeon]
MKFETDEFVADRIKKLGEKVTTDIFSSTSPTFNLPVRAASNIHYNKDDGLLYLGTNRSTRDFFNFAHTRKFMQTLLVASKCKELIENQKTASIRELYYELKHNIPGTKENTFEGQDESDPLIEDLETMTDSLREQLHLKADSSGILFGKLIIEDMGDRIDCSKLGKSGLAIPSIVDDYKFLQCDADYVLVVETKAMVDRLVEEKFHLENNAILVGLGGQAARGARRLIKLLNERLKLPVYVFTDGDPWGYYIYSVVKTGSMNLAYESKRLATPNCRFLGMTMDDVDNFSLHKVTEHLKDVDKKRINQLLSYEWFKKPHWVKELKAMLSKGIRIEQQALASKSLEFVAKEYLPQKIAKKDFID